MLWEYKKTLGAFCSVAAVVFLGYIGTCFLAVAVVLGQGTTSSPALYFNLAAGLVLVALAALGSVPCCCNCTSNMALN